MIIKLTGHDLGDPPGWAGSWFITHVYLEFIHQIGSMERKDPNPWFRSRFQRNRIRAQIVVPSFAESLRINTKPRRETFYATKLVVRNRLSPSFASSPSSLTYRRHTPPFPSISEPSAKRSLAGRRLACFLLLSDVFLICQVRTLTHSWWLVPIWWGLDVPFLTSCFLGRREVKRAPRCRNSSDRPTSLSSARSKP